jgi:hypothetical protein
VQEIRRLEGKMTGWGDGGGMGRGQPALRSFRKKCRAGWLRWTSRNQQGKKGLVSKKEASVVRTMKQPTRRRGCGSSVREIRRLEGKMTGWGR